MIISFVPFWLSRESHARVGLAVTTVLTMTTLITNTASELPKVSHLTALDVYLFTCFTLVFASLIEYAIVGYFDLLKETGDGEDNDSDDGNESGKSAILSEEKRARKRERKLKNHRLANRIDYVSRKLFPAFFVLFHLVYIAVMVSIMVQNSRIKNSN